MSLLGRLWLSIAIVVCRVESAHGFLLQDGSAVNRRGSINLYAEFRTSPDLRRDHIVVLGPSPHEEMYLPGDQLGDSCGWDGFDQGRRIRISAKESMRRVDIGRSVVREIESLWEVAFARLPTRVVTNALGRTGAAVFPETCYRSTQIRAGLLINEDRWFNFHHCQISPCGFFGDRELSSAIDGRVFSQLFRRSVKSRCVVSEKCCDKGNPYSGSHHPPIARRLAFSFGLFLLGCFLSFRAGNGLYDNRPLVRAAVIFGSFVMGLIGYLYWMLIAIPSTWGWWF